MYPKPLRRLNEKLHKLQQGEYTENVNFPPSPPLTTFKRKESPESWQS